MIGFDVFVVKSVAPGRHLESHLVSGLRRGVDDINSLIRLTVERLLGVLDDINSLIRLTVERLLGVLIDDINSLIRLTVERLLGVLL